MKNLLLAISLTLISYTASAEYRGSAEVNRITQITVNNETTNVCTTKGQCNGDIVIHTDSYMQHCEAYWIGHNEQNIDFLRNLLVTAFLSSLPLTISVDHAMPWSGTDGKYCHIEGIVLKSR